MELIKVLQIAYGFEGGVGRVINEYYSKMDRSIYSFDVISWKSNEHIVEQFARNLGMNFYFIDRDDSWDKNYKIITSIMANGNYDVVHFHGVFEWRLLKYAKSLRINKRIVHSHCSYGKVENEKTNKIKQFVQDYLLKYYATELWGCGRDALKFQWGSIKNGYIMRNAVDLNEFSFDAQKRQKIRNEYRIGDCLVIGCVARLTFQKNHEYMINVFEEIHRLNEKTILLLVGSGELEPDLKQQVDNLGLKDSVIFMGVCKDVKSILNAMDVFVLTSRWEGLPVSLIEAQANGLNCVMADTITDECAILPQTKILPLNKDYKQWANTILKTSRTNKEDTKKLMREAGFDISVAAREVSLKYGR